MWPSYRLGGKSRGSAKPLYASPVSSTFGAPIPAACWLLLAVVWIVGAVAGSRNAPRVTRPPTWGRVPGAFVVILVIVLTPIHWSASTFAIPWLQTLGLVILVASTAFAIWARLVLGTMWSYAPAAREGHELRTTGPYAITRHPIYTGITGMLIGTALASGQVAWAPVLVAGVVLLLLKARREEDILSEVFGEDYERYRATTPG